MEEEALKKINKSLKHISTALDEGFNIVDKMIKSYPSEQQAEFKAYLKRYMQLIKEGRITEAQELEKKYKGGE